MSNQPTDARKNWKSNQLLLVKTGPHLISLINVLTALEMQNSGESAAAESTTAALRELARYEGKPSTYLLLLVAWHEAAQTHVPYVSVSFEARDEHAQFKAVNALLARIPRPHQKVLKISAHGNPEPGLQEVIEMLCREALL